MHRNIVSRLVRDNNLSGISKIFLFLLIKKLTNLYIEASPSPGGMSFDFLPQFSVLLCSFFLNDLKFERRKIKARRELRESRKPFFESLAQLFT